jgi:hypothetical protein
VWCGCSPLGAKGDEDVSGCDGGGPEAKSHGIVLSVLGGRMILEDN